jgi:hypothetical protein
MYSGLSEKPEGGGREVGMMLGDRVNEEGEGRLIWESMDDSSPDRTQITAKTAELTSINERSFRIGSGTTL